MPGDRVPFGSGPKLSGTLPAALASNQYIETLWLKNNLISGTLPPAWQALGDTLLELDLPCSMCSKCTLGSDPGLCPCAYPVPTHPPKKPHP
mgnify:CR=1 FL=1|jgi:hypothetical protein